MAIEEIRPGMPACWSFLFKYGPNLFIFGHGKSRVAVNKDGRMVVTYKAGPEKSPRCEECQLNILMKELQSDP